MSVTVVSAGLEATAGSAPKRFSRSGTVPPEIMFSEMLTHRHESRRTNGRRSACCVAPRRRRCRATCAAHPRLARRGRPHAPAPPRRASGRRRP